MQELQMNDTIIFFDMDGVLAKWEENGNPHEKGFMLSRKPDHAAIGLAKKLKETGYEVAVLSAVYNTAAELEKVEWLEKVGLGNVIHLFVPFGSDKSAAVTSMTMSNKVLVDDYSKNLHEWEKSGNIAVKYYNGINGTHGTWAGKRSISKNMNAEEMMERIFT